MQRYSIKDVERISGIKAHTLRIWEKRYNLVVPHRTETNIRYYTDEDLRKLLNVAILRKYGFKISRIVKMSGDILQEKVMELTTAGVEDESRMEGLILAMIEIDEGRFEHILNDCVERLGFEHTILDVIYPFFKRVGLLWQSGAINPAQEHFISNLIRQKIISAIASLRSKEMAPPKTFLLFLPEGELHELGLLFHSYLIQKFGHKVIYLGQTVPLEAAIAVNEHSPADYLLTSALSTKSTDELNALLQRILDVFPNVTVILTQQVAPDEEILKDGRLIVNYSLSEFKHMLSDF